MTRKTYHIQAMSAEGAMLMDIRVDTRAAEKLAIREAIGACDTNGGGWMRQQTEGARGWGVYVTKPGEACANRLLPAEAVPVIERFDRWVAAGGAS